jgi:hypothetical protein
MDLGLMLTTRQTFAGMWGVLALAMASGRASTGALVLLFQWLGRAAQVWIAALVVRDAKDGPRFLHALYKGHSLLQKMHLAALAWTIVALGFLVNSGGQI